MKTQTEDVKRIGSAASFGPGCRVRVDSSSTYKGRYGTITEVNGMPDRWFVAIDDDDQFAEVSFYAGELVLIIPENDLGDGSPDTNTQPSQ